MDGKNPKKIESGIQIDISSFSSNLENSFQAKYTLIGVDRYNMNTDVAIRAVDDEFINTEIRIKGIKEYDLATDVNVVYSNYSDVFTEIHPSVLSFIPTNIYVRPNNSMVAIYEVKRPPIITEVFNPVQDSFTRTNPSFQAVNYGKSSSMVVGKTPTEQWRSIIQFDMTSLINTPFILTDAHMRLYYRGAPPNNISIDVFQANDDWQEYSITELNRPKPFNLITDNFTKNEIGGYIEFNMLDIVESILSGFTIDKGFILQVGDSVINDQTIFYTRESAFPPEMIVKYYDSTVYSFGRSNVNTDMFVKIRADRDKLTEIIVHSDYAFSNIDTSLYVHVFGVPILLDAETELYVNKTSILSEITININTEYDLETSIAIKVDGDDLIDTELYVQRKEVLTEIKVVRSGKSELETVVAVSRNNIATLIKTNAYRYSAEEDLYTEVTARVLDESDVNTDVAVSKNNIPTYLKVAYGGGIDALTEVVVRAIRESDIDTEILVTRDSIKTEILIRPARKPGKRDVLTDLIVKVKDDVKTEISVSEARTKIPTEIWIGKPYNDMLTELKAAKPRRFGVSERLTEIRSAMRDKSDVITELYVNTPDIPTEITASLSDKYEKNTDLYVSKKSILTEVLVSKGEMPTDLRVKGILRDNTPTEIFVSYLEDMDTEINVHITDNVLTEIDVIIASKIPTELAVSRGNITTEIFVPYWDDSDTPTEIHARGFMVNDMYTDLFIGTKVGAYAFIM